MEYTLFYYQTVFIIIALTIFEQLNATASFRKMLLEVPFAYSVFMAQSVK